MEKNRDPADTYRWPCAAIWAGLAKLASAYSRYRLAVSKVSHHTRIVSCPLLSAPSDKMQNTHEMSKESKALYNFITNARSVLLAAVAVAETTRRRLLLGKIEPRPHAAPKSCLLLGSI